MSQNVKIIASFTVHPKRADQMIDLVRGLGADIFFEAPVEIEVITNESTEETASPTGPAVADTSSDESGSAGADATSTTPQAVETEGLLNVSRETIEVKDEQLQRTEEHDERAGDWQQSTGGDAIVSTDGSNADADGVVAGPAGEEPAE